MRFWIRTGIALLAGAVVFAATVAIGDRASERETLATYWPAPDFALVDQTGSPVATADLMGRVWIASFIFTSCADVCPAITARMARLSDDLRREGMLGESVRLVSFTVDPERDTPAVLREYARGFGGLPPAEWAFLTGDDGPALRAMVQEGFHLTAMMPDDAHEHSDAYQVMHAPRVLLVDASGVVRGIYDATDADAMNRVVGDARSLLDG
jgi:protein SCO1/2